jgi:hypothetical protein
MKRWAINVRFPDALKPLVARAIEVLQAQQIGQVSVNEFAVAAVERLCALPADQIQNLRCEILLAGRRTS